MIAIKAMEDKRFRKDPRNYKRHLVQAQEEGDYHRVVRNRTRRNYKRYKDIVNPENRLIAPSGMEGAHHVDHIVSVNLCWMCKVPVEFAAAPENLQVIPWYVNAIRGELDISRLIRKDPR